MFFLNKTRRRVIFWLAVMLFILAAPLVIAYSQGLRFDFVTREIVRVGAIALDSEPDEARIFFNGEFYHDDTPAVIRGLLPGHLFHVRVERDGHYAWEKTLSVEPQKITSARGIHLFPVKLDLTSVATATPSLTKIIPQGSDSIFLSSNTNVYLLQIDESTTSPLVFPDTQNTLEIASVEWHQDGTHVLFSRRTTNDIIWYVWNTQTGSLENLNQRYRLSRANFAQTITAPQEFNAAHVVFLRNGATRFLVSLEGRIYSYNTSEASFVDLGIDNVAYLYSSGNRFFAVNGESTVLEIDANGNIVKTFGTLGFIPERMLLSPNGQRLFYESNGRGEIVWLQEQELDWHRDVGDIDVIFEEESEPTNVWWHASSAYILSEFDVSGRELVAYEIDVRDVQNIYRWSFANADSLSYQQQGSRILVQEDSILSTSQQEF